MSARPIGDRTTLLRDLRAIAMLAVIDVSLRWHGWRAERHSQGLIGHGSRFRQASVRVAQLRREFKETRP